MWIFVTNEFFYLGVIEIESLCLDFHIRNAFKRKIYSRKLALLKYVLITSFQRT